mgnify:CR=1 FL=1
MERGGMIDITYQNTYLEWQMERHSISTQQNGAQLRKMRSSDIFIVIMFYHGFINYGPWIYPPQAKTKHKQNK